jgi:outer membrane protein, multidrug efflux system
MQGVTEMSPRMPRLLLTLVAAGLAACAVGPDYERPELDLPEAWRVEPEAAVELANAEWWMQFGDPVLDELIATALAENLDIAVAAARVAQFEGALRATRSSLFPQVGYGAGAGRARSSEFLLPAGADPYQTQFNAALSASWQLDLFGRLRRESEAAQARVYASEQARRGVMLTVVAGVAAGYITLLSLDSQLEVAKVTSANYERTLALFRLRHSQGVISRLEVAQVESQYEQAASTVPRLEALIAAQEHLLSILLGRPPGPIPRGGALRELTLPAVPAALPSSLLEQRPDVLEAEQNLAAANADLGAAQALYFPDISLTGLFGAASTALDDLLESAARTWSAAGTVSGPIFTGGAIRGQVEASEAAREAALLNYRATVLEALREVNDSLVNVEASERTVAALDRRAGSLADYARLARMRFDAGAASFLDVLVAENELFAAELARIGALESQYANMVALYRALGGGW